MSALLSSVIQTTASIVSGASNWTPVNQDKTLAAGNRYLIDTTAQRTLTLPSLVGLAVGASIDISDGTGQAKTNNIIIKPSGTDAILAVDNNLAIDLNSSYISLVVTASGWKVVPIYAGTGQAAAASTGGSTTPVTPTNTLFPVAGRLFVPYDTLSSTYTDVLSRSHHPMFDAINGPIEIQWPNWRATTGQGQYGGAKEILHGATATATANVSYIDAATFTLKTVNLLDSISGSTALSAADGANFIAVANINNVLGTDIYPQIAAHFPNGGFYGQNRLDTANGDIFQYGSTPIPLSNTPVNTYADNGGFYGPCMIRATTSIMSAGDSGDSRNSALKDVANTRYGNIGPVQRLVGKRMPVVNVSVPGETAIDFAVTSQSTRRRALLNMLPTSATIFYPLGTNDIIFIGKTSSVTKTNIDTIASSLNRSPIYVTIDPATTGGITTPVNPSTETDRRGFNTTVRALTNKFDPAKSLESATTPGAWADASYVSSDYTHESNIGNQYAVDNSGFDFSLVGSPAVLNMGFAYPSTGLYQSLNLNTGWSLATNTDTFAKNAVYSPEHKISAAVLTEGTAAAGHSLLAQVTLAVASTTRTFTVFVKRNTGTRSLLFQVQRTDNYADCRVFVNLGTGANIYSQGSTDMTLGTIAITQFEAYYKLVMPITFGSAVPANPYILIKMVDSSNNENYTGDGTSSIAVWGVDAR
jgi:hypothetical protein